MDERALIAELIRWVMGIPAERVTWHHVVLVLGGMLVWVLPAAMRIYHFVHHLRFIRSATPEQLAAYTGKLPPPKPPSLGGPVTILALLCALGLASGGAAADPQTASAKPQPVETDTVTTAAKNCCRDCDPPSRCVKCHCEAATKMPPPPKEQPRAAKKRDERLTATERPPLQSELTAYPASYEPRWYRYLPES